jgi:hypothetical protein
VKEIRLLVVVREGDFATFNGSFGSRFVYTMEDMGDFEISARKHPSGEKRWHALARKRYEKSTEISVSLDLRIDELQAIAMTAADTHGLRLYADHKNGLSLFSDHIQRIWLTDITSEELSGEITVREAGLDDGDVILLCIEHAPMAAYLLGVAPNPESLFRSLVLGAQSPSPNGSPRLWGILLYTDSDVEIATYVREQFDELNALSGPLLRVFVLERPENWRSAKRYWRGRLEPSLYRVFGALQWLKWRPYERFRAYDIARQLGIDPQLMPCLVLLRSAGGTSRITFPITGAPPSYLRRLFGEILRTLGTAPEPYSISRAADFDTIYLDMDGPDEVDSTEADRRAFDLVASAEDRIKQALEPHALDPKENTGTTYVLNGFNTVLSKGSAMSDNFNFYGQTTFINRPVDTVIQDFQNAYSSVPEQGELGQLLRLVLSSKDLPDGAKEEAATTIHEVAGDLTDPGHDTGQTRTKLERLRATISRAADIAAPALEIIAAILSLLAH